MAIRRVHLLVEGAVIPAILSDVGITRLHAVEGCVEITTLAEVADSN